MRSLRMFHLACRHTAHGKHSMAIQSVTGTFFAAAMLSIALAGVSWAGDPSQKDESETD